MTQPLQTPGQRLDACLTPHLATQQRLAAQLCAQQEQMLALTRAIESTRQEIENLEFQMATAVRVSAQADPGLRRILGLNIQDVANAHELQASAEDIQAQPEPTVAVVEDDLDAPMPHGVSGPDRVCARVHREKPSEEEDLDLDLDLEDAFDAPEAVLTDDENQANIDSLETDETIDPQDDVVVETPEIVDVDTISSETDQATEVNAGVEIQVDAEIETEPSTEAEAPPAEAAEDDAESAEAQALVAALDDALCDSVVDSQVDNNTDASEAAQPTDEPATETDTEPETTKAPVENKTQQEAATEVETEQAQSEPEAEAEDTLVDPNDPMAGIDMNAFDLDEADSSDADDKEAAA